MDQSTPKVIKLGLPKSKSHHIIQKTYMIYTPKIIKFIYHANSSNIEHLPLSLQIKEPESIYSSGKKNNKSSNGFKTPKIKLVSRKTTQLEQKSDKNYPSVYCSSKSQKIVILSKTKKKSKQLCSSQQRNAIIKTEPIVDILNCDLFGCIQPLDKEEIYLAHHNFQKVQSRIITISHPIQIEDQPKYIYPDVPVQAEDEDEDEKNMLKEGNLSLSRRNKIFEPSKKNSIKREDIVQNNTIMHSFSRRKRIFQRTQSQRKNYQLRNSLIRRNKIFSLKKQKKKQQIQYIKLNSSEIIDQSQIPGFALDQWLKQSLNKKENHLECKYSISKQALEITNKKQSFNDL